MLRRTPTTKQLRFERLEERQVLAGNVLAYMSGGDLWVVENTTDIGEGQAVQVWRLANGQVRVQGLSSQDGGTSLVNGHAYQDFSVPTGNLRVYLGGGRDTLLVGRNNPSTFNEIYIDAGVDSAPSGSDLDAVYIEQVTTLSHLTIDTGATTDYVQVIDTKVGDGYGIDNLSIYTGEGADQVNVIGGGGLVEVRGYLTINTYNSLSELDADRISMSYVAATSNVQAFLGNGNDSLDAREVTAYNDIFFSLEGGNDTATLNSVRALDDFWAYFGDGDDTLDAQYLRADVLTLDGGAGFDRLRKSYDGPVNTLRQTNWENINGRNLYYFFQPMQPTRMSVRSL